MLKLNALLDTSFFSNVTSGRLNVQEFLPVADYNLWLHDTCLKEACLNDDSPQQKNSLAKLHFAKKYNINFYYLSYLILEEFIDRNPNIKLEPYLCINNSVFNDLNGILSPEGKEKREGIKDNFIKKEKEDSINLCRRLVSSQGPEFTMNKEYVISTYMNILGNKKELKDFLEIILHENIVNLKPESVNFRLPGQYKRTLKKLDDLTKNFDREEKIDFLIERHFSQGPYNILIEQQLPSFHEYLVFYAFFLCLHFTSLSFCLMSELSPTLRPEKQKIYFEKQEDELLYLTLDSKGERISGQFNFFVKGDLTKEFLENNKEEILEILKEINPFFLKKSKLSISPDVIIMDFTTNKKLPPTKIKFDENTRQDLHSTVGSLKYVDVFATCDKSHALLLNFLYPEYKDKIRYYSLPAESVR